MKPYDHKKIEKKWQAHWSKHKIYTTPDKVPGKDNFYLLVEFPYPSGNLHVGHWYAFAVPDMLARYQRMQGKNVLYPIGFDAFGLPAENAAIKHGLNPRKWTEKNIAYMTKQIQSMGTSFDWSRKVSTIDPAYYKWTQWLFLQLYKKGLAYQKETAVNWCPKDKTVLANEQVVNGRCERCDSEVEQKQMLQWNMKITDYADRLVDDLDALEWPEQIKESQRNWIGRSEGAEIDFKIANADGHITVFTTRADTLFGATYLVLAPEHPLVDEYIDRITNKAAVREYIDATKRKSDLERQENKEKTGVKLEGLSAINPATGEDIPLYIADYVLGQYGTGAIMAVPAHDERDREFAQKFDLPIRWVVEPRFVDETNPHVAGKTIVEREAGIGIVYDPKRDAYLCLKWKQHPWTTFVTGGIEPGEDPVAAMRREITEETGYTDVVLKEDLGRTCSEFFAAHKDVNRIAHNRVFLFSLNSNIRAEVTSTETDLHEAVWLSGAEVESAGMRHAEFDFIWSRARAGASAYSDIGYLVESGEFDGLSGSDAKKALTSRFGRVRTTYRLRDWIVSRQRYWGVPIPIVHCAQCGAVPVAEKQLPVVLPNVRDYLPEGSGKSPLAKVMKFTQVKCPVCKGKAERETDTLDTFVDSSWYFLRYADPKNRAKFADQKKLAKWLPVDLYSGGAEHTTMHLLYSRFWHKALYDMKLVREPEPYKRRMNRSIILGPDGQKMSKSRGNVIDPDEVVRQLGADTVRMYLAFIGPYSEVSSYPWNPDGVVGVRRFLERIWRVQEVVVPGDVAALDSTLHKTIKKVGEDLAAMKFNTAIAQLMICLNDIEKQKSIGKKQWAMVISLLAPLAPHIAEELWSSLGKRTSVHKEKWPQYDKEKTIDATITMAVQINGKTRGEVQVPATADKVAVEAAARAAVSARLDGKVVARTIIVPKRLVNFVVAE